MRYKILEYKINNFKLNIEGIVVKFEDGNGNVFSNKIVKRNFTKVKLTLFFSIFLKKVMDLIINNNYSYATVEIFDEKQVLFFKTFKELFINYSNYKQLLTDKSLILFVEELEKAKVCTLLQFTTFLTNYIVSEREQ